MRESIDSSEPTPRHRFSVVREAGFPSTIGIFAIADSKEASELRKSQICCFNSCWWGSGTSIRLQREDIGPGDFGDIKHNDGESEKTDKIFQGCVHTAVKKLNCMDWIKQIVSSVAESVTEMGLDQEHVEGKELFELAKDSLSKPIQIERDEDSFSIDVVPVFVNSLTKSQETACLDLLDANLGRIYTNVIGRDWKVEKVEEMRDSGLIYLLLYHGSTFVGFVSMKALEDNSTHVIYIYELQVSENFRGMGLGTKLLHLVNDTAVLASSVDKFTTRFGKIYGLSLTVFGENQRAQKLYFSQGFEIAPHSPRLLGSLNLAQLKQFQKVLQTALIAYHKDHSLIPSRIVTTTPYATHLFMASTGETVGMKALTGSKQGFTGVTTILDKEVGFPIGILNAATLTAFRTALCTTLTLVKALPIGSVGKSKETLVCFGVGAQAQWHIRLALILYPQRFDQVIIVNRSVEKAEALADDFKKEVSAIEFKAVATADKDLKFYFEKASCVFGCVPSTEATILADYVVNNSVEKVFIGAIGSYKPHMIEIEGDLLKESLAKDTKIVVDSISHCLDEAGEFIQNDIGASSLIEVSELYMETPAGKEQLKKMDESKIVISKIVGLSIMDVSVGHYVLETAKSQGLGIVIDEF
ncbi:hypothetical protein OGAPHI_005652 [Ogataea philodendri]|uniref:N-acetyltransferase domain-containing protein n=1 Tax=Ogataea philodendri TaxID=1378263 RepID=A0A9P8NZ65_9ASCO|nr:uncharacterized protein OGAPHI_005652 [Ogataea philodendri]KAH3662400.1 hypothetical protein OGAPHI_005652 [Ogataea philodendri]